LAQFEAIRKNRESIAPILSFHQGDGTMMQTDKVLARQEGQVGHVTFNNPERHNAVSPEMWEADSDIIDGFARSDAIRVVVLADPGGKAFISGADISRFESERSSEAAIAHYNTAVERANAAIYHFPKPTIAMIRGYCIGGGVGLSICCDLRIRLDNHNLRCRRLNSASALCRHQAVE
jgi:enoyl-CoA hydratase